MCPTKNEASMGSYLSLIMLHIGVKKTIDIKEEAKSYVLSMLKQYFSSGKDGLSGDCAIEVVTRLQRRLEKELERTISKKSVYYWLHIFRRDNPLPLYNEKLATISLWREIAETAFLKYGKRSCLNDMDIDIPLAEALNGKLLDMLPYDLTASEKDFKGSYVKKFSIRDAYEYNVVKYLAFEYWYTTATIRRIHKGGVLNRMPNNEYQYSIINENERLIKIYDDRCEKFGGMATFNGVILPKWKNTNENFGYSFFCNIFQKNEEQYPIMQCLSTTSNLKKNYIPRYLASPFDFDEYYKKNSFHEQPFSRKYNISFQKIVYTLKAISLIATERCYKDEIATSRLMMLAYYVTPDIERYVAEVVSIMNTSEFPYSIRNIGKDEVKDIIKLLSRVEDYERENWIQNRYPKLLSVKIHKKMYLIDYCSITGILMNLTRNYDKSEEQIPKGEQFESDVKETLIANGIKPWDMRYFMNNDNQREEVDCIFEHNGILFILECKSIENSHGYERGEKEALKFRENKLEIALKQVDKKADMIVKCRGRINHLERGDSKKICALVITPFCEYIWSEDSNYWLSENLPRVCTVYEMIDLLKETAQISQKALRDLT